MEDSDLIAMVQYRRLGELDLWTWLKSLRNIDEGSTFSLDDPMPFVRAMALLFSDTLAGRWRRRKRARALAAGAPAGSTA